MAANEGRRVRVNGTQHLHSIVLAHGFPRLEAGSLSFSEIARAPEANETYAFACIFKKRGKKRKK